MQYIYFGLDYVIDHFRDFPMDSQTTDITHLAVVFPYDVTIKALEILRSTANYIRITSKTRSGLSSLIKYRASKSLTGTRNPNMNHLGG